MIKLGQEVEMCQQTDHHPDPPSDSKHLRMAMHLNLLNANAALHRLREMGKLQPDEETVLHATEQYLGAAK